MNELKRYRARQLVGRCARFVRGRKLAIRDMEKRLRVQTPMAGVLVSAAEPQYADSMDDLHGLACGYSRPVRQQVGFARVTAFWTGAGFRSV